MRLSDPVYKIDGVGAEVSGRLERLGIYNVGDLLHHYPARYEDYSTVVSAAEAKPGKITVKGKITRLQTRRSRKGTSITEALITDESGSLQAVWFNQPYLSRSLPRDEDVYVSGELDFAYNKYALQSPTVEVASALVKNSARIISIYPETDKISSKQLRRWIYQALSINVKESLPKSILNRHSLLSLNSALKQIHFPDSMSMAQEARKRLAFEELLVLMSAMKLRKSWANGEKSHQIEFDKSVVEHLLKQLPFDLTDSQRVCSWQIIQDLSRLQPMNRLLQGDVGSGKTVVAAIAMVTVAKESLQSVLIAPTEILARQHYETLLPVLKAVGIDVELLIGSTKAKDRTAILSQLSSGRLPVIVGTHALLENDVELPELGLVVIDEQHRFGVEQRRKLITKPNQLSPHVLSMTATPIPRSLALTVYGDIEVSRLKELPTGRKLVITRVVDNSRQMHDHIGEIVKEGKGVYIVCPLIDDSDTLGVASVDKTLKEWQTILPNAKVAGLHGKMPSQDKQRCIEEFKSGDIDVLVSTTVIEVGVDAANAAAIVIEGAERFGLAQLHQLRGRVGRSSQQSYCYLKPTKPRLARKRLKLLESYYDGERLAQADLELRGPGQLYGVRQHGLLDLRLASITDFELIKTVRDTVSDIEIDELPVSLKHQIYAVAEQDRRD